MYRIILPPDRRGPLLALLALSLSACGADGGQDRMLGDSPMSDQSRMETGSSTDGAAVGHSDDAGADADPVSDSGPATDMVAETMPLLPWREGNTWTYRVLSNGVESTKVTRVEAEEEVGGTGPNSKKRAFRVVTTKGVSDRTVSWQANLGQLVVRYREQSFAASTQALKLEEHWDPYKLRIDNSPEGRAAGAAWVEEYQETKLPVGLPSVVADRRDQWVVDSPSEEVTVPAGTFRAVVLQKASVGTPKTYWFVPGIGKVKEMGGQTEELVSYEVFP